MNAEREFTQVIADPQEMYLTLFFTLGPAQKKEYEAAFLEIKERMLDVTKYYRGRSDEEVFSPEELADQTARRAVIRIGGQVLQGGDTRSFIKAISCEAKTRMFYASEATARKLEALADQYVTPETQRELVRHRRERVSTKVVARFHAGDYPVIFSLANPK